MTDKLLSVGFVSIEKPQIKLGSCYYQIINTEHYLDADNVIIHQITDQQKSQGKSLRVVVEALLKALAWKVMLIHFARIEKQFLRRFCLELYGVSPPLMLLDTLVMTKRKLVRSAIATAEILLVQQQTGATKLKHLF